MSNAESRPGRVSTAVQDAGLIVLEGAVLYASFMLEGGMKLGTVIYERTRETRVHDRIVEAIRDRKDVKIKPPQGPQA